MTIKNIPVGYKDSPLGIIPQEWEVKRLGEVCKNKGDYGINAPAVEYSETLPTYLRITDIDDSGRCCFNNKVSVNNMESCNYLLYEGDIVFARTGATVGKSYLYNLSDGILVFAGFLIRFSINTQKLIPYFLKSYVETNQYWNWVKITSQRSGQPGINANEYCSLCVPLPPLSEQEKIAEILSTWDKAIEKQIQLIQKLELRKKGLMQQLLTGKKRLPGFTGEWKKVKFSSLIDKISNGYTYDVNSGGNIPITRIETISKGFIDYMRVGYTQYVDTLENYRLLKGDILFSHINSIIHIGKVAIYKGEKELYHGMNLLLIRAKQTMNKNYLYYFLSSSIARKKVRSFAKQAVNQASVNTEELKKWILNIPSLQEQTAIANILSSCDEEIRLAQDKLAAMKEQKKGLMQVLLTGKRRIIK